MIFKICSLLSVCGNLEQSPSAGGNELALAFHVNSVSSLNDGVSSHQQILNFWRWCLTGVRKNSTINLPQ